MFQTSPLTAFIKAIRKIRKQTLFKISTLLLPLLIFNPIFSKTFFVTNTSDYGNNTLRVAINNANSTIGNDTILFNISTADQNYDPITENWTITIQSLLPYILDSGLTIDATSQPGYNGKPVIIINCGNSSCRAWALGIFSSYNRISGFCITGFDNAILLSEPTSCFNIIENCFLGTNALGSLPDANINGITINNNSNYNIIRNNLISGNTIAGIILKNSNYNSIIQNKIGCDFSGEGYLSNENGIIIDSSSFNTIGNKEPSSGNQISGNKNNGVLISGRTSHNNILQNNLIGTNSKGSGYISNTNGISILKSYHNIIGKGNLISGNTDIGVLISGKHSEGNIINGNLIGTDITGTKLLKNDKGIVIKSLANNNIIGGHTSLDRNIISGNIQIGIYIEASDSNQIKGNFIGTDIYGKNSISLKGLNGQDSLVQGNGIEFNTVAKFNTIGGHLFSERNIISGHKVYGVVHYGNCSNNSTINNFIGTDITSQKPIPNATGICFDCASHHNLVQNCVISGNMSYGLFFVTRGTEYNKLQSSMIGVDSSGTKKVPNDIGMVISTGTANNLIGGFNLSDRNIFSGNNLSGLMITNQLTENNTISGNYLGTDITGKISIPNLYGLLISTYARGNKIINNLISGNQQSGIILTENTDSNYILSNKIGTEIMGLSPLPNGAGGIFIDQGAINNQIGNSSSPNIIGFNIGGGILLKNENTKGNRISNNKFLNNKGLGIDIIPFGSVNLNDPGDFDSGTADLLNYPLITLAHYENGKTSISGRIDTQSPSKKTIEIYISDNDSSGYGEGKTLSAIAYPDDNGVFSLSSYDIPESSKLTAIAIDEAGNTSEFAQNTSITTSTYEIESQDRNIEIYPNPVIHEVCISPLNIKTRYLLKLIDINGYILSSQYISNQTKYCTNLKLSSQRTLNPAFYIIEITDDSGNTVAKKVYIN